MPAGPLKALSLAFGLAPASPSLPVGAGPADQRPLGPVCSDHILRTSTFLCTEGSHWPSMPASSGVRSPRILTGLQEMRLIIFILWRKTLGRRERKKTDQGPNKTFTGLGDTSELSLLLGGEGTLAKFLACPLSRFLEGVHCGGC